MLKQAVVNIRIDEKRYNNYLKIQNEFAYSEMSCLEKHKKYGEFGKIVKRVLKVKKTGK